MTEPTLPAGYDAPGGLPPGFEGLADAVPGVTGEQVAHPVATVPGSLAMPASLSARLGTTVHGEALAGQSAAAGYLGEDSRWVFAPDGSHLNRWLVDGDVLTVRFKGSRGAGETRPFSYALSPGAAEVLSERMRRALHPFGQVFYGAIVQSGIPYM